MRECLGNKSVFYPLYLLTIGIFHPMPKALGVILMDGVACRRLYSEFLTRL